MRISPRIRITTSRAIKLDSTGICTWFMIHKVHFDVGPKTNPIIIVIDKAINKTRLSQAPGSRDTIFLMCTITRLMIPIRIRMEVRIEARFIKYERMPDMAGIVMKYPANMIVPVMNVIIIKLILLISRFK